MPGLAVCPCPREVETGSLSLSLATHGVWGQCEHRYNRVWKKKKTWHFFLKQWNVEIYNQLIIILKWRINNCSLNQPENYLNFKDVPSMDGGKESSCMLGLHLHQRMTEYWFHREEALCRDPGSAHCVCSNLPGEILRRRKILGLRRVGEERAWAEKGVRKVKNLRISNQAGKESNWTSP